MYDVIRAHREMLGYTQVQLSVLSGVSLPTIQNIEAGRANPSWDILEALANSLGLRIQTTVHPADWEYLVNAGLPLNSPTHSNARFIFDSNRLASQLKQACLELNAKLDTKSRSYEALHAFLFVLNKHYPVWFRRNFGRGSVVQAILNRSITGRTIKLGRQALRKVSEFL